VARTAPPSFDLYRGEVEDLIDAGEAFPGVANAIEKTEFSHDDKSALWLIAWITADMQHRGRDKIDMLRLLRGSVAPPIGLALHRRAR